MRIRPLAAALAAVALATACTDTLRPEDQLSFTVGLSRNVVAPTDTLVFAANIVNQSSENVAVERPCGRIFEFEVTGASGTVVLTTNGPDFPCVADSTSATVVLPPGQLVFGSISTVGLRSNGTPLAPGTYTVRAVVRPAGTIRRSRSVTLTVPSS